MVGGVIPAWAEEITFDFEDSSAHRTGGNNSYTETTNSYTENGASISLTYADAVTSGSPLNGNANVLGRIAKSTKNSPVVLLGPIDISGNKVTSISYKIKGVSAMKMVVEWSTDNSTWNSIQSLNSLPTSNTTETISDLNITGTNLYIRFTVSVSSAASSRIDFQLDDIIITHEANTIPISSISFDKTSATIDVGGNTTITPTILPANTTETAVWESNNTKVATVSNGVVTGVAVGSATITLISPSDNAINATCSVTVFEDSRTAVNLSSFAATQSTLVVGNTTTTTVTNNQDGWTAAYTYSSDDESVATVSSSGIITAVAKGTANITVALNVDPEDATYKAGATNSISIPITVKNPSHTATFSVNGNTSRTALVEEGEDVSFPTEIDDIDSKKFVGWYSSSYANATIAPTFITSAIMGDADVTYYAVFASSSTTADELTTATFGSPSGYTSWSNKSTTDGSSAIYAGNSTTSSGSAIQINNNSTSGIVSTTSGGKVKKIEIEWNSSTTSGRTLDIYGKNTAYSSATDLYDADTRGTKLGSIVKGTSTELTIDGDYAFIGLRSNDGAMYLQKVTITWNNSSDYITNLTKYALSFSNPTGGTIEVKNGEDDVTTGETFYAGTSLDIEATPSTGYTFDSWTATAGTIGNSASATTTFTTAESASTLSAIFTLNSHTLSTSATNGSLAVTVDDEVWDGSSEIPYGATVIITPTPSSSDYVFSTWTSDDIPGLVVNDNPLEFTMPDNDVNVSAYFAVNTPFDITVDDKIVGGTISADKTSAKTGVKVVLSYSVDEGYRFDSWTVLDKDENDVSVNYDSENEEYYFIMPESNVEVSATLKRVYTITYKVTGVADDVRIVDAGSTLDVSAPAEGPAYTFAGWSTSNDITSTPSFTSAVAVNSDMTLYAIYATQVGGTFYQKVTATNEIEDGEYLIVYEEDNIAFDGSLSTLDAASNIISVTITDGTIPSNTTTDASNFTIEASNGYIKSASGKYIGRDSNKNGMDTDDSGLANTITINDGNAVITGAGGYCLRFNSSTGSGNYRFRYYSSTSQQPIQLYKKVSQAAIYTLGEKETVTVSSAGYATYCSNKALDFSKADDGLKAYIVTSDGATTDYTQVNAVPASTGLLLKADEGTYNVLVVSQGNTDVTDNKLVGVLANTGINATDNKKTNYVLRKTAQYGVGFYKVTAHNDGQADFTVKANSAYLSVALSAGAREFIGLIDDETTAIDGASLKQNTESRKQIFDLQGRRVNNPQQGIYIVNGKKVVIK